MSFREHLRELRPHAEWWAIEKLREKLGEWIAESVVIAVVFTIAQKIRGIPFDWWVLGTLFVVSFGFLAYSHRRDRRQQVTDEPRPIEVDSRGPEEGKLSLALSQAAAASTTIDTGPDPLVVVFVVGRSYVNHTEGKDFPLKLHVMWANEGEEIHLGRPQWVAGNARYQGERIGQGLAYRYKNYLVKRETESEEITAKRGQKGELWIGLDQSIDPKDANLWSSGNTLGTLVLPVTVREVTTEIRIRL